MEVFSEFLLENLNSGLFVAGLFCGIIVGIFLYRFVAKDSIANLKFALEQKDNDLNRYRNELTFLKEKEIQILKNDLKEQKIAYEKEVKTLKENIDKLIELIMKLRGIEKL